MTVYFVNKTGKTVIVELNKDKFKLNNNEKISFNSETNELRFNCCLNEASTFKYLPLSKSVIVEYSFVLNSLYDLTLCGNNCELEFVEKQIKGNNLELYKLVDLQLSANCYVNSKEFYVADEAAAKKQLSVAREKEIKLEKRLKVFDILQDICYIGIPALIILIGIWYFVDFKTALGLMIPLTIVAVAIGLLLKKLIFKFNNKLEKFNSKSEKKTNLYVNTNSFFNKEYILDLLKNTGNDSVCD